MQTPSEPRPAVDPTPASVPVARRLRAAWPLLAPVAGAVALGTLQLLGPPVGLGSLPVLAVLVGVVFAAAGHAEAVAERMGPALGGLLLAAAVTVIEVALIISLMRAGGPETAGVARDAVFASLMLTTTGITGAALLVAGLRLGDAAFQSRGATSLLSVLTVLAVLVFVMPDFTLAVDGPVFSTLQLGFVSTVSLSLYGVLLFTQTVRNRELFVPEQMLGAGELIGVEGGTQPQVPAQARRPWLSVLLLVACLVVVVLLADALAPAMHALVTAARAPFEVAGILIAVLVLLPEALVALRAAYGNRLQVSINVALGSALASIGLTIPVAALVASLFGEGLRLGISTEQAVLLALALLVSTQTLASGRATILQGAVHLTLCAAYVFLAFRP